MKPRVSKYFKSNSEGVTMGAEKITSKIVEDANKNAEKILAEALNEKEAILTEAKEEASKKEQAIAKKGEKDAEMTKNRILAEARLSAKKKLLEEREKTIQLTLEKLEEDLVKLPQKEEYKDILLKMIISGVYSVGGGELELLLNKKDFEIIDDSTLWALEKEMEDRLKKVTVLKKGEAKSIIGGCIIKTADQTKVSDNSLEATFERNLDSVRAKIAEMLF